MSDGTLALPAKLDGAAWLPVIARILHMIRDGMVRSGHFMDARLTETLYLDGRRFGAAKLAHVIRQTLEAEAAVIRSVSYCETASDLYSQQPLAPRYEQ